MRIALRSKIIHCAIAYVPQPENPLMFEALPKKGGIFLTPIKAKTPQRTFRPPVGSWNEDVEVFNFSLCNQSKYSLEDGIRARLGLRENNPNAWMCAEHVRACLLLVGLENVNEWGNTPANVLKAIPKEWEIF
jgi:hypothetical protein